jgi:hypothetical protein
VEVEAPSARALRAASAALLVWFAARAVYFAVVTPHAVPPDEIEHFGRSAIFARGLWPPADSPDSWAFGLMRARPWLYPWLMGRLLAATPFEAREALLFLRLANVAIALLTLAFARRAMALYTSDPLARGVFLWMATHTLMFTFLAGSVNYDNLANLCAAIAFGALFAHLRAHGEQPGQLALLATACLAGTLTKEAFVPLAAILLGLAAWRERRAPGACLRRLCTWIAEPRPARLALAALAGALLAANLELYVGNWLRYGRAVPRCAQVLSLDACLERPNDARDWVLDAYRSGELSLDAALARAETLSHPQLRRDTRYLVRNFHAWQEAGRPLVDRFHYAFTWSEKMARGATGILGHLSLSQPAARQAAFELLWLAAALGIARRIRAGEADGITAACLVAIGSYALILMQFVNYPAYAATGSLTLAVQGRYLFVLLVPIHALVARTLVAHGSRRLRFAVAAAVALVFLSGDLPFYLRARTPGWVGGP